MDMKDQFNNIKNNKDLPLKEQLQLLANEALPLVKAYGPILNLMLSMVLGEAFGQVEAFKADAKTGKYDAVFAGLSAQAQAFSRDDIKQRLTARVSDLETAKKEIIQADTLTKGMTDAEQVAFISAVLNLIPDAYAGIVTPIILDGKTIEEAVSEGKGKTVEQRAQDLLDSRATLPVDMLADGLYDLLQKATPDRLKQATISFIDGLDDRKIVQLASDGLNFGVDLLQTVKTTNTIAATDKVTAQRFGQGLKGVFNAAVSSLEGAGISLDTGIRKKLELAVQSLKAANNNVKPAPKVKKKKPGNTGPK